LVNAMLSSWLQIIVHYKIWLLGRLLLLLLLILMFIGYT